MKLWAIETYTNSFEIEVDDNATEEEIIKAITDEDNCLGGDWTFGCGKELKRRNKDERIINIIYCL